VSLRAPGAAPPASARGPAARHRRAAALGCALVAGALWLLGVPAPVSADGDEDVRAEVVAFVDARTGRELGSVEEGQEFWVRYAVDNELAHPVEVTAVTSWINSSSDCVVTTVGSRPGVLPEPVAPGGSAEGEDTRVFVRDGACLSELEWESGVESERVPSSTSVSAEDHDFGESTRLEAEVTSRWSESPGSVEFTVDGRVRGESRVRQGTAVLTLPAETLDPGAHKVRARYRPAVDGPAGSTSPTTAFEVERVSEGSATELDVRSGRFDEPVRLRADVSPTDAEGRVRFELDGGARTEKVTLRDGRALLEIDPGELSVGEHDVVATFTSADDDLAGSSSERETFQVRQVPTSLDTEVAPAQGRPGGPLTVWGRLVIGDGRAAPPEGARVDVLDRQGDELGTARLDGSGAFEVSTRVPELADPGRFAVFVSYPGTASHAGALDEHAVEVVAPPRPSTTPTPTPSATPTPTPDPTASPTGTEPSGAARTGTPEAAP
ncbi:Ig-like domain-containing protein, partial [Desertihabitans aurantiacus]|uniref:Ig-like domain-containing protein n=1 Tax=Desertihabitans aurantiacus TaxID=2282477 RepID=UPI001300898F